MPAQASSAWMRRENAGWVTWRNWAEREKLRVSARLMKSSSHLVSTVLCGVLQLPHASIAPAQAQQYRVGTPLDDAPGFHHEDLVRIDHRRQPVRDDQRGLAA